MIPAPRSGRFGQLLEKYTAQHGRFSHPAHIHLAWQLLEESPALEALATFNSGLLALAERLGLSDRYNATLTTVYFFLVLERRKAGQNWEEFAAGNADLLDWEGRFDLLGPFYAAATLASEDARQGFIMPKRPNQPE